VDLLRERQVGQLEHERDRLAHVADHDLQLCKAIEHTGCDQPGRVQPGVHVPAPGPDRQDWVFGIKFRPAGFRPLLGGRGPDQPAPALGAIFGAGGEALTERIRSLDDDVRMAQTAEQFIHAQRLAPDPMVPMVNGIVARIMGSGRSPAWPTS
jgi:hypothetical protein